MPYFIASPCIDVMDKSCIEECPVDCNLRRRQEALHQPQGSASTAVRASPRCPEGAMLHQDFKAPPTMARFVANNRALFAEPFSTAAPRPSAPRAAVARSADASAPTHPTSSGRGTPPDAETSTQVDGQRYNSLDR